MGKEAVLADSGQAGEVAARVGRVRRPVCLSILHGVLLLSQTGRSMNFLDRHIFSPQPARHRHGAHTRHGNRTGPWGHESRGANSPGWSGWLSAAGAALGVIMALSWTMVFVLQAPADQGQDPQRSSTGLPVSAVGEGGLVGSVPAEQIKRSGSEPSTREAEPVQGPALTVPEEMVAMFQQRKQDLDRRENAVRAAEAQLAILKTEVEKILSKVEAVEQRRLARGKPAVSQVAQGKLPLDTRTQQLGQLVKMYESMPAEEAAERIERMNNRKALEILRLLKSKAAGAILAQVKVDRAAKLSEEFLTTP